MENKEEFDPQLIDAVKKQIEYYFSKENLQTDAYLTSQMDAQMSVPISVVMKFAKLKALTQDEAVVRRALVDSSVTIVDNRIKANIKSSGRSTIILREIPSDAPEEEVKEIFNYDGCKPISSIRSDIGDTWFVTMETEDDAKDTALDLRLKKRTFRGQAVKARIKTEPVVRSFFPVSAAPPAPVYPPLHLPFPPVVPPSMLDLSNFGYLPVPPPVDPNAAPVTDSAEEVAPSSEPVAEAAEATTEEDKVTDESNNDVKVTSSASTTRTRDVRKPTKPVREVGDSRRKTTEPRRTSTPNHSKDVKEKKTDIVASKPPIEVNAMTFPPLLGMEDTPIPTPGYKDTYVKYNFDAIINIVKNVKEALLPSDLNPADHPIALTSAPNMDLLKRQRTFSIDETREQLRQGRPVQREAIISGAVDYRSLIFGDDQDSANKAKPKPVTSEATASTTNETTTPTEAELVKAVEEKLTVAAEESPVKKEAVKKESEEPAPSSPQRISASTWAAMVKSSALATENQPITTTTTRPPAPKPVAAASAPVDSRIKKAAKEGSANGDKTESKTASQPRSQKGSDKEKKFNSKEYNGNNRNERRKNKEGNENKPSSESVSSNHDGKTEENAAVTSNTNADSTSAPETGSSGAWGKATFANVLKQKLSEEATEESTSPIKRPQPSSTAASTNNTSHSDNHKPLKLNSRGNGLKDSTNSHRENHRGERRHRDREGKEHHSNNSHSKRVPEEKEKVEEVAEK